ncbi:MAG: hypothetical protein JWM64_2735 [Frankiales bacterium]|nr:hypothetical protein [Frankiales bacterium]
MCGYGPVGALLAARLAAHGLSVTVVDRSPDAHPLPRAVAADGEVLELLERTVPGVTEGFVRDPPVRFLAADRTELGRLRFPVPGLAFYAQPVLEARLRASVGPLVEVRTGTLTALAQDAVGVTALVDGEPLRARWLVGCDGASSTVRRLLGVGWRGRDLQRWLVCDVVGEVPERPLFTYTADPALPQVDMPVPGGHRWEWLDRGGLDPRALLRRDTDADVEVVRATTYRFSARRAERWRVGRVLLAGDAAHTMPPFAGQGLGAGLRDAWALAAMLGRDDVGDYERLRVPHVRRTTALSLALGAVLQARHPGPRDALLRAALRRPWVQRGGPRPDVSGVLDL